jgi:hypothetical protein
MAPQFITKRLLPCAGTPVHVLACGHTIHASFLHPTASSKCAPNCKDVNMATNAEPSFLCPICFESQLRDTYQEFVSCCKKEAKKVSIDVETVVVRYKEDHEGGRGVGEKHIDRMYDVFMKYTPFEKMAKESYKLKLEKRASRGCKAVDGEYEEEVEVVG